MNILYLNHYAGSPALGMEFRPYYLAREWVRAGHRVQIVGADFSHVRARQPNAGDEVVDGIACRWLATRCSVPASAPSWRACARWMPNGTCRPEGRP